GAKLHHERRVGGRRDATGRKVDDGQGALLGNLYDQVVRCAEYLCLGHQFLARQHLQPANTVLDGTHVAARFHDVARTGLALGADHRRAFAYSTKRLAKIARATNEWHFERMLVNVVALVCRRQHFALVDVVDTQRLEDLRLHEVANPTLGHYGDGHGLLNA